MCIVYPSLGKGAPFIPTLQWEGIREGIDDYRYLYTLNSLIEKMKKSKDVSKLLEAKRVEKELNQMLQTMPWQHTLSVRKLGLDGFAEKYPASEFTNTDANRYRKQIAGWIVNLLEKE